MVSVGPNICEIFNISENDPVTSYNREKIHDRQANTIPLPFVCKL